MPPPINPTRGKQDNCPLCDVESLLIYVDMKYDKVKKSRCGEIYFWTSEDDKSERYYCSKCDITWPTLYAIAANIRTSRRIK